MHDSAKDMVLHEATTLQRHSATSHIAFNPKRLLLSLALTRFINRLLQQQSLLRPLVSFDMPGLNVRHSIIT